MILILGGMLMKITVFILLIVIIAGSVFAINRVNLGSANNPADSFFDIFVEIPGAEGSSSDPQHDKWIDVLSIDWGAKEGEMILVASKPVDKSSPKLMQKCLNGEHIPSATVEICRKGPGSSSNNRRCHLRINMFDLVLSHEGYHNGNNRQTIKASDFFLPMVEKSNIIETEIIQMQLGGVELIHIARDGTETSSGVIRFGDGITG